MLPIVLVSLFVSSALALPTVSLQQYNINEIAPVVDNGRLVSSYLTDRAFEIYDAGNTNVYILTVQQILNDLANQPDALSQALAVGQTIAVLGELASSEAGDACDAAAVIDAYVNAGGNGNSPAVRSAVQGYLNRLASNIGLIASLASDPNSLRGTTGPRGNCAGRGRSYNFEAAWNSVFDNTNAYQIGLVNEQYCAAKRLYSAFDGRSNNVGAQLTAAALKPVNRAVQVALNPLANFLRDIASGRNPGASAARAQNALRQAGNQL